MKRLLADTNFYGMLAKDSQRLEVVSGVKEAKSLVFYGFKTIRDELRDVPKNIRFAGKNIRIDLLNLYEEIVTKHVLEINDDIKKSAEDYYRAYREFGGSKGKEELINDFVIVACASLNNLDLVVSNDERSMLAENAVRAYDLINSVIRARTPRFISYEELKQMVLRGEPNEFV